MIGDDDLLARILQEQRSLDQQFGLPQSAAGLPHHKAYFQILQIIHWERVITGRFGPKPPRGFIERLKAAIAEALKIKVNQVDKWRKAISACRRGKRSSVPALKVKS